MAKFFLSSDLGVLGASAVAFPSVPQITLALVHTSKPGVVRIADLHFIDSSLEYSLDMLLNALLPTLAQVPHTASGDPRYGWLPVLLLLVIGIGFAVTNIALSIVVGPGRTGPGKETTYESGMNPIGDTRKRFNVRFYVVAMIFLVFDVDIIFFYPLCSIFPITALKNHALAGALLVDIFIFVTVLLVAYLYAWGKGVFRWD